MTYSASRTLSAGSDRMCCPTPQSYWTPKRTDAIHSPDGHLIQASWIPGHQFPSSASTSTARGGSMRLTFSLTPPTVGARP